MALSDDLFVYVRLERLMMELDDQANPLAEKIRDLMDPLWYSLLTDDREYLNSRGLLSVRTLYPVTLVVPELLNEPTSEEVVFTKVTPKDGVGKRLRLEDNVLCAA
jgi:hypothetical protein